MASSPEKNNNNSPACVCSRGRHSLVFSSYCIITTFFFFIHQNPGKNFITGTARNGHTTLSVFFSRVRIATKWKRMCHVYNLEATLYTQLYNCISNKKCPVMDIGVSSLHLASSSIEPHPHTRRLIQLRTCRGKMAESIGGKNQRFYRRDNTSIG